MAEIVLGRLKFKWRGNWAPGTAYIKDDVVKYGSSSYVCTGNHTSTGGFPNDQTAGNWEMMLEGGSPTTTLGDLIYRGEDNNERLPIGSNGQALIVTDGVPQWVGLSTAQDIYYVKADGDDNNDGSNLNQAFKTIKHACDVVEGPATIYVRGGLYAEQLPIKVGANVTVVGDGQRITGVKPLVGTATGAEVTPQASPATSTEVVFATGDFTGDMFQVGCVIEGTQITGTVTVGAVELNTPSNGFVTLTINFSSQIVASDIATITTDYSEGTMWHLNDGAMLNKMYFTGMTGFEPNLSYPEDITQATIAGVFVAFDPLNPIVTKSPYVIECACFSTGGIGAVVDGDVHASGIKSMVFHGYTCINSDGVGYWVHGEGKAEIVSCFTYYCWFGYTTTGGGKIRALNGNNSYGTYGAVSSGYLSSETTNDGALYGNQLEYVVGTAGSFDIGEIITGGTSGATGRVLNQQGAANKLYFKPISGTFQDSEIITGADSSATAVLDSNSVAGQQGFILVANQFESEPKVGGSVELTGDTNTYVIQSYTVYNSSTWLEDEFTGTSSVVVIVLAGEKPTASVDGTVAKIRYQYSQTRLTGHDFLSVGTGNKVDTNYPGTPANPPSQANEVIENYPGRVFYVSTDQDGNFRVGEFFKVDQATGRATLNASAFDLSGLTSLKLGAIGAQLGETINEFSSDTTLSGDSNQAVPTEHAVKTYLTKVTSNIVAKDGYEFYRGTDAPLQADTIGLTGLMGFFTNDANEFSQLSIQNTNSGSASSTDFIAYADNGDNDSGWIDMGITSSNFNDTNYGVTLDNDGYIFMSAKQGAGGRGNLFLSTSDNGTQNDIVLSTNGFAPEQEVARFVGVSHDGYAPGLILQGELEAFGSAIYQGKKADGTTAKDLTIDDTGYVGLTDASGVFTGDANAFVQFALKNHNSGSSASTDIIAYTSNGDNESGWIDMGITSATFTDTNYGVTGANDGYIFMSAPVGSTGHGNLYLSTSDNGTQNDIVFSTDGFAAGTERMRIVGTDRVGKPAGVEIYIDTESTSTGTGALRVQGGIGLLGNLNIGGDINIVGNITLGGTGNAVTTQSLAVSEPIIFVGDGNPADLLDLGFVGEYTTGGTETYSGFVRDATDGKWKLFSGANPAPGNTVDFTSTTYDLLRLGTLEVYGSGGIVTNQTTFPLINTTATTVNFAGAATTLNIGAGSGTTTVNNDLSIGSGKVFKINGTEVLSSSALGSGVTSSSLTAVGTITSGTWNGSIVAGTYGGTGVNNGTKTITLGGNLTTSGAYNTTLTVSADTNVTLPTSGTLAVTGSGLNQFASTTSSQLAGVISDETGSGSLVFATSPTLVTPTLGAATATSINGVAITASTGGTLTLANSSTLATSGAYSITLTATGATNVTLPTSGTLMTTTTGATTGKAIAMAMVFG